MTDGNATTTGDARRAIRQRLESLQRAGVTQIGRIPEYVAPAAPEVSTTAVAAPAPIAPAPIASDASEESSAAVPVVGSPGPATPNETSPPRPAIESTASETPRLETGNDRAAALEVLASEVAACKLCDELCSTRTQTVFGVGDPKARLMFFGEAPGADEDRLGEPFVGAAGKLLTKIIEAMKLTRDDVYILNTLKCRPPGNRNPLPDEVTNCRPYFDRQLEIIQPEIIVCLGAVSAQNLLETTTGIGRLRGKFHDWNGAKVVATYHPAYLLRNPSAKKMVWEDMKMVMAELDLEP